MDKNQAYEQSSGRMVPYIDSLYNNSDSAAWPYVVMVPRYEHSDADRMAVRTLPMALQQIRHGSSRNQNLYKTALCDFWTAGIHCRFGHRCWFAHGPEELRSPRPSPSPYIAMMGPEIHSSKLSTLPMLDRSNELLTMCENKVCTNQITDMRKISPVEKRTTDKGLTKHSSSDGSPSSTNLDSGLGSIWTSPVTNKFAHEESESRSTGSEHNSSTNSNEPKTDYTFKLPHLLAGDYSQSFGFGSNPSVLFSSFTKRH